MSTESPPESPFLAAFQDPEHAANYRNGPPNFTPGFFDMHRMTQTLLREYAPQSADILVHGAGGGLELAAFAQDNPGWRFVGVDPAAPMIAQAKQLLGDNAARTTFHHGYIDDAPEGPFDAATSLLTLHFLDRDARRQCASDIIRRLKPGAPFVVVHSSFQQDPRERDLWLSRYAAFAVASGVDPDIAEKARNAVAQTMTMFDPGTDANLLREAGLRDVSMFYAAFTWRGWVGVAP